MRSLSIDPNIAAATTLSADWYVEPSALALEQKHVFGDTWQYATGVEQLQKPGTFVALEIADRPIVLVRDLEGVLRGFYNVCRHRAGPVASGAGTCQALKCAYHGWTYGLDGQLKFTPELKGIECFEKGDFSLIPIAVDTFGPFVFVNLGRGTPSLADVLGKIPAETDVLPLKHMRFYKRHVYELNCNWKVYVDNYLEGYHIPLVHPGLFRELSYPDYRVEVERYYSKQHAPVRNKGDSLYRRSLPEGAEPVALYYWVFPNLMFNIYPDNVQINTILPLSHNRTATVFEWYLLDPERPDAAKEFADSLAFSDLVQQEDITICEQVQKGLSSGAYSAGRYAPTKEMGVHHFHSLLAEYLQNEVAP